MDREKIIYLGSILALLTAAALAWAVSHPCDCHQTETTEAVAEEPTFIEGLG